MAKDDKPRTRYAAKVLKREGINWKTASSAEINAAYERDMRRADRAPEPDFRPQKRVKVKK